MEAEERREDGVGLLIAAEALPEVEVASLEAGELSEVRIPPPEAVGLVADEARLYESNTLRSAHGTAPRRVKRHQEALRRSKYPSKGSKGAQLGGKLWPLPQVGLFVHALDTCTHCRTWQCCCCTPLSVVALPKHTSPCSPGLGPTCTLSRPSRQRLHAMPTPWRPSPSPESAALLLGL